MSRHLLQCIHSGGSCCKMTSPDTYRRQHARTLADGAHVAEEAEQEHQNAAPDHHVGQLLDDDGLREFLQWQSVRV